MTLRAREAVASLFLLTAACRSAGPREEALTRAILAGDVDGARAALASGADLGVAPPAPPAPRGTRTFAWLAISEMEVDSRHADALEQIAIALFAAGASPNHQVGTARRKVYLIERAALTGRPRLIDAMVKAGLDVRSEGTGRALVGASRAGHSALVERLLAAGADVNFHWWNAHSIAADTPLSEAVYGVHPDTVELLEHAGAREW